MKIRTNQHGFSAVELVIALVIVAVLGFVGYTVYNRQNNKTATTQPTTTTSTASNVPSAPIIDSAGDLDKASATLDQVDPASSNSSDSSQLDAQLTAF